MAKNGKEIVWGGLTAAIAAAAGAQAAAAADFEAPVDDWTGLYLGVGVGMMGGQFPENASSDYKIESDVVFGGFIGYNQQVGSLVWGGELALQSGADSKGGDPGEDYQISYIADAKVKLGMDAGSFMPYVFAGISGGEAQYASSQNDYGFFGVNYGLGADVMVTEQFSLGAEVMGRTIIDPYGCCDGASSGGGDSRTHYQGMLRAAFHF
jgi:outer membrane immunogenic protein